MTTALQEVLCEDCSESLGYQAAAAEVNRAHWKHNRCPVRIAEQLDLSPEDYEAAVAVTVASLAAAYPEFTRAPGGAPPGAHYAEVVKDDQLQTKDWGTLRAEIAAGTVLQALSTYGFAFALNKTETESSV